MNQINNDRTIIEGLVCESDPKYTAELLIRSHEGLLTPEQEADLQDHLRRCERCRAHYESLSELDFEMMLVANDDNQLRKFSPDFQHAEKCLPVTWERLERFAEGKSEREFINDEELEKHIDECVYCRRRSIIIHRRVKYKGSLPLAFYLAEQAVYPALNIAGQQVWKQTISPPKEISLNKPMFFPRYHNHVQADMMLRMSGTSLGGAPKEKIIQKMLSSGKSLDIAISSGLIRLKFPSTEWAGKIVSLISQQGKEYRIELNNDGLGLVTDLAAGQYQLLTGESERFTVSLEGTESFAGESRVKDRQVVCVMEERSKSNNQEVRLNDSKEDLIQRLEGCDYCIFEEILSDEQRKIKVLDLPVLQSNTHRVTIEYACGKNYAGVCPMKYAAMRGFPDDFTACQLGAIKDFIWDLGKKHNKKSSYNEAILEWTKSQDLGRGIIESYAQRFREIWNLGLRKIGEDKKSGMRQNLTSPQIYEIVVATPAVYELTVNALKKLVEEARQRETLSVKTDKQ